MAEHLAAREPWVVAKRNLALLSRFGRALRKARQDASLTQEELADRAGLAVSYISLIENGHKSPSVEVVFALAQGLQIAPHVLVRAAERRARAAADEAE